MKNLIKNKKIILGLGLVVLVLGYLYFTKSNQALTLKKTETEIETCRRLYNEKTPESWKEGADICDKLAGNGNAEAQYIMGMMLKEANHLRGNKAAAFTWLYEAYENGFQKAGREKTLLEKKLSKIDLADAYYTLSNSHSEKNTTMKAVKIDEKASFDFSLKSADYGHKIAQMSVATAFARGWYYSYKLDQDLIQAYKWSYLASREEITNNSNFTNINQKERDTINNVFLKVKSMSTSLQIEEGRKLAEEWIKNNPDLVNMDN